jgi:hypothetical protein
MEKTFTVTVAGKVGPITAQEIREAVEYHLEEFQFPEATVEVTEVLGF